MKKHQIILFILVALYVGTCAYFYKEVRYAIENNSILFSSNAPKGSKAQFDLTYVFNKHYLFKTIEKKYQTDSYNRLSLNYMFTDSTSYYNNFNDPLIYIFSADKVLEQIEKNGLKNNTRFDVTNTKYTIPFGNKNYDNILGEFAVEKKQPKIISTDKDGNPQYDISTDAVILYTVNNEIISYIYIDGRLADTRKLLNTKNNINTYISINSSNSEYNKYEFDFEDEPDYRTESDYQIN